MIKCYRQTDRIPLEISGVKFLIKPLSYKEKMEITKAISMKEGNQIETLLETTKLLMKFAIKGVEGITYHDGTPIELAYDEEGLSDESINELMGMEITQVLNNSLSQFANGVPDEILDENGKPLKDVKILPIEGIPSKKK